MIDEIAALTSEEVFAAGSISFQSGESADSLFILEDGGVEITIGEEGHTCFPLDRSGDRLMQIFEKHPAEGLRVMRRLAGVIASRLVKSYHEILTSRKESEVPSYG